MLGKRRGLTGQLSSILGFLFGIAACALLWHDTAIYISEIWPSTASTPPMTMFLPSALACALIYGVVYMLMLALSPALRIIMMPLGKGPLNSLCGAIWGVAKYTMLLSLLFNVLLGMDQNSSLMKVSRQGDGNLVTGVMLVAPALTGAPDCEELAYRIQLMEAKQFDRNHRYRPNVY